MPSFRVSNAAALRLSNASSVSGPPSSGPKAASSTGNPITFPSFESTIWGETSLWRKDEDFLNIRCRHKQAPRTSTKYRAQIDASKQPLHELSNPELLCMPAGAVIWAAVRIVCTGTLQHFCKAHARMRPCRFACYYSPCARANRHHPTASSSR